MFGQSHSIDLLLPILKLVLLHQNSLDSKAIHEHDVVPEGSVDIQVYLLDLCGEATSLLLHFLGNENRHNYCKTRQQNKLKLLYNI